MLLYSKFYLNGLNYKVQTQSKMCFDRNHAYKLNSSFNNHSNVSSDNNFALIQSNMQLKYIQNALDMKFCASPIIYNVQTQSKMYSNRNLFENEK
jgi:hypothetical protein